MSDELIPGRSMASFAGHGSNWSNATHVGSHDTFGWGLVQPWEEQAACQDTPIELWFGQERPFGDRRSARTKEQTAQAKAICARCPVLDDCRQWALESGIPYGFIAGMNETERRRLLPQGKAAWAKFWKEQDKALGRTYPNRRKTHCKHGHEYTPENTRTSNGRRFCLACQKRRTAVYRVRKREELGRWPWEDWPSTKQRQNGHKAD